MKKAVPNVFSSLREIGGVSVDRFVISTRMFRTWMIRRENDVVSKDIVVNRKRKDVSHLLSKRYKKYYVRS